VFHIEFLGKKSSLGAILEDPSIPKILGFGFLRVSETTNFASMLVTLS
jgi:hypothetical protein